MCAFVEQLEKKRISLFARFEALWIISGLVWSRHVKGQLRIKLHKRGEGGRNQSRSHSWSPGSGRPPLNADEPLRFAATGAPFSEDKLSIVF